MQQQRCFSCLRRWHSTTAAGHDRCRCIGRRGRAGCLSHLRQRHHHAPHPPQHTKRHHRTSCKNWPSSLVVPPLAGRGTGSSLRTPPWLLRRVVVVVCMNFLVFFLAILTSCFTAVVDGRQQAAKTRGHCPTARLGTAAAPGPSNPSRSHRLHVAGTLQNGTSTAKCARHQLRWHASLTGSFALQTRYAPRPPALSPREEAVNDTPNATPRRRRSRPVSPGGGGRRMAATRLPSRHSACGTALCPDAKCPRHSSQGDQSPPSRS